ncbi:hypothetical protein L1049_015716 [Liquidambar formosana]|uniref:DUF6598 domain-containing protein n=1 Tax=Liquidambar formosana TaxID=63359 RepID=A0AAP0X6A6_LIQFO
MESPKSASPPPEDIVDDEGDEGGDDIDDDDEGDEDEGDDSEEFVTDDDEEHDMRKYYGRPMFELFSMHFMSINEEYEGRLYGEIRHFGSGIPGEIYKRSRENAEIISSGDSILLCGPSSAIYALDPLIIEIALTFEYKNGRLDDEAMYRWREWNFSFEKIDDTPKFEDVVGLYGKVVMNYALYSNAVLATVEVKLFKRGDKNSAKLYGKITARNTLISEDAESVLFRRKSDETIDVLPKQVIPLSRSIVSVPLESFLVIEANMWDSFDNEIANGIVKFRAHCSWVYRQSIHGESGWITVRVTWGRGWMY